MTNSDSPQDMGGAPPVALIAGPTASGKSAVALTLARFLRDAGRDAVIINADASQVYGDIPILSAAPTAAERADVPHRLFGHIDGAQPCDAARWAGEAKAEIAAAHARGTIPILVGGTGLYIRTLLDGIAPVPAIDEGLRRSIRALRFDELCRMIEVHDPDAAVRLDPADTSRMQRALEVVLGTGTPLHVWQEQREGGILSQITLVPMLLLPPRPWLRQRIAARLDAMLVAGAMQEVERLNARHLDPNLPVMRAIGVAELTSHIAGELTLSAALGRITTATGQYAKRQSTWFRNQPPADWPRHIGELNDDVISEIAILLRQKLLTQ